MLEECRPVRPPEIREVQQEKIQLIEFYIDLGEVRPDLLLMELVTKWLRTNAYRVLISLNFSYTPATPDQPACLVGNLYVGGPIDVG